jgi:hypothetical protein
MLANNNLYNNALDDINEMELAWNESFNGDLIVILEAKNENKIYVINVKKDNDESIISPIETVLEGKKAINHQDMNDMINIVVNNYPSERYSIVLWSHATGWLPPNTVLPVTRNNSVPIKLKSFGESNDMQMDIRDLANGIPNNLFDIIIFDACYMGNIEVLYEIKDKANYIIASPSEIIADGFPYKTIIPLLFEKDINIRSIGEAYFDYYDNQIGSYRSATIGVVKTSELRELAIKTSLLMDNINELEYTLNNLPEIQSYDRYINKVFFDFKQTMESIYTKKDNDLSEFQEQLNKTILYSAHTNQFINIFEIKTCSGLSCFIPNKNHTSDIKTYYKKLKWYNDSGFEKLFNIY